MYFQPKYEKKISQGNKTFLDFIPEYTPPKCTNGNFGGLINNKD